MAKPKIIAKKLTETSDRTTWLVEWMYPALGEGWGERYRVVTYRNGDVLLLQTLPRRGKVADSVAAKILPQVRAAIAAAS